MCKKKESANGEYNLKECLSLKVTSAKSVLSVFTREKLCESFSSRCSPRCRMTAGRTWMRLERESETLAWDAVFFALNRATTLMDLMSVWSSHCGGVYTPSTSCWPRRIEQRCS